jgi:hypothetical protein
MSISEALGSKEDPVVDTPEKWRRDWQAAYWRKRDEVAAAATESH